MGPNTVTASRILRYGEGGLLSFEKFPHIGLLKTYCVNKQVPDSASTATALFCGSKTNYETSGVDANVELKDCPASMKPQSRLESIIGWAQRTGKSTGFVTTTRVTHATPSALYSHTADRRWECEAKMNNITGDCEDIAVQLVRREPGKNINVIMGGGRQCLVSNSNGSDADPIDTWACISKDGRDLISEWKRDKEDRKLKHSVVQNTAELQKIDPSETDYVFGIFANGHLKYEVERDKSPQGMPSLKEMTDAAIKILQKNKNGFILVVEGGLIDQAHHRGTAARALYETLALDDAVASAVELTKPQEDTLIVVTSDHSHTLSINGYPKRGNHILDVGSKSRFDDKPYTTLTYATGGPGSSQLEPTGRRDPSQDNTRDPMYQQQALVETDENTHGGNDVLVYAKGPFAHLFHSVHEQSYVAHAIGYATKIGPYLYCVPGVHPHGC
ncbi:LOW QUALITY PROTEIN: alkaline phosphatase, tissue-nonspecific isozyme-like [Ctenocephalides felis]|uniref:LOW QUALITY PROTEIN: alkaline phosphatase, tissue-nonspecific isozyme-like n=1 Tax=Ctenocephalides felis TaxID=7515 RepID=UPI000E6E3DD2|nr:LOW QUALITY PROTEIN: alkaline phosphatase, tissue-nonspecific isozyme-like [Ctenocephalides felis]